MVKINRAKIKQGLKTTAKTAGILAISGAVGIGSYNVADRISRQKVFNEIKSEKVQIKPRDRLDAVDSIAEYNRKAKISEIYFYKGEKVSKINIDVAKLGQITRLLPDSVRTNINTIINNKIKTVNLEMKRNPKLRKIIEDRIGVENYRRYLLSLPMEKLEKVFTPQELKQIRTELNKIPKEKLKELHEKLSKTYEGTISLGVFISLLLGAGLFEASKSKKKDEFNFH